MDRFLVAALLALSACARAPDGANPAESPGCFVLPGVWEGRTQSYRVESGATLELASEVSAPGFHVRAAPHPSSDLLFVTAVGSENNTLDGVALHVFDFTASTCTIGDLRQTVGAGGDNPSNERTYGLAVHPNGRWIYQATASLGQIRVYESRSDGTVRQAGMQQVPQPDSAPCLQVRRLLISPDGGTLYSNCNNAQSGADFTLHSWRVLDDGALRLRQALPMEGMDMGVFDPVLHPSGAWLYQPMSGSGPGLEAGPGAYVLVYSVGEQGELDYSHRVPVRTISAADGVTDPSTELVYPVTLSVSGDGRRGYVAVHASLATMDGVHEFVELVVEDSGGDLTVSGRRSASVSWEFSSHHGGTIVESPAGPRFVSYLTDYDTIRGGIVQSFEFGPEGQLVPSDPPYFPTGLMDARQPIAVGGR